MDEGLGGHQPVPAERRITSYNVCYTKLLRVDADRSVRLAFRPVHLETLTDEVETVPPKARVY